jgi:hypothetical protein
MKVYWGSGFIAPRIIWPRHQMEVIGQLHAPVALPQGKSPRRESNPRTPIVQPVTWSLYRLSYHMWKVQKLEVNFQ